jgi:hypothetical protein
VTTSVVGQIANASSIRLIGRGPDVRVILANLAVALIDLIVGKQHKHSASDAAIRNHPRHLSRSPQERLQQNSLRST